MYAVNPNSPLKNCERAVPTVPAADVWNAMIRNTPTATKIIEIISSRSLPGIFVSAAAAEVFPLPDEVFPELLFALEEVFPADEDLLFDADFDADVFFLVLFPADFAGVFLVAAILYPFVIYSYIFDFTINHMKLIHESN